MKYLTLGKSLLYISTIILGSVLFRPTAQADSSCPSNFVPSINAQTSTQIDVKKIIRELKAHYAAFLDIYYYGRITFNDWLNGQDLAKVWEDTNKFERFSGIPGLLELVTKDYRPIKGGLEQKLIEFHKLIVDTYLNRTQNDLLPIDNQWITEGKELPGSARKLWPATTALVYPIIRDGQPVVIADKKTNFGAHPSLDPQLQKAAQFISNLATLLLQHHQQGNLKTSEINFILQNFHLPAMLENKKLMASPDFVNTDAFIYTGLHKSIYLPAGFFANSTPHQAEVLHEFMHFLIISITSSLYLYPTGNEKITKLYPQYLSTSEIPAYLTSIAVIRRQIEMAADGPLKTALLAQLAEARKILQKIIDDTYPLYTEVKDRCNKMIEKFKALAQNQNTTFDDIQALLLKEVVPFYVDEIIPEVKKLLATNDPNRIIAFLWKTPVSSKPANPQMGIHFNFTRNGETSPSAYGLKLNLARLAPQKNNFMEIVARLTIFTEMVNQEYSLFAEAQAFLNTIQQDPYGKIPTLQTLPRGQNKFTARLWSLIGTFTKIASI